MMSFYGPVRILVVLDQPSLVEMVKNTLNRAVYTTRAVTAAKEVTGAVHQWQPHLAILDIDREGGQVIAGFANRSVSKMRLPVIGLTRRGDVKFKLAAFEAGVDDILTIPFASEELLARVTALVRHSYSDAVTFTPMIKVGGLEIDILKHTVRVGWF